jgi:hydroxyacylglutathione hydrolase
MRNVLHVPAFKDNYVWLIHANVGNAVAIVDPGDAEPVMEALQRLTLRPVAILCTHHHRDHVGGVETLARRYGTPVYGPRREIIPGITHPLNDGDRVDLPDLGLSLNVIDTPGHTLGQINYYGDGMLYCGDTLFSAGCGRLFEGTAEQLHASLSRLAALPEETRVYAGHEYTEANLKFALSVEPHNADCATHLTRVRSLRQQGLPTLPSTIGLEQRINPFLRAHEPSVRAAAEAQTKQTLRSTVEVFAALRRWKDGFAG